jgi:hypothetical protein
MRQPTQVTKTESRPGESADPGRQVGEYHRLVRLPVRRHRVQRTTGLCWPNMSAGALVCTTTIPIPSADLAGAALWVAPTGPTTFERQDRFAAFVGHELRTLIALQRALVELALTDPHANIAALRAMAEEALASCEQQQLLIEALLDLTPNRRALNRQLPVDIAATTKRALQGNELGELDSFVALEPAVARGDPNPRRATGRQPYLERDPTQHPARPNRSRGPNRRSTRPALRRQHRPGHPSRRSNAALPALRTTPLTSQNRW